MNRPLSNLIRSRLALAIIAASLSATVTGCSKKAADVPVTGHVTVNGKPAAGATVVFHPVSATKDSSTALPVGRVDEKGDFQVSIPKSEDGTVASEYRVTLTWFVSTATKQTAEGESMPLRNQLPEKYSRTETTPLTTTVKPEGTEPVSFDIKVPTGRY